jgi:hypothetical protein
MVSLLEKVLYMVSEDIQQKQSKFIIISWLIQYLNTIALL